MALLSERDSIEVRKHLENLVEPVTIHFFTKRESPIFVPGNECPTCKDARSLMEEVAGLSDKLRLSTHEDDSAADVFAQYEIPMVPALVFESDAVRGKVRYFGLPSGHEFAVFLGTLLDASRPESGLSAETLEVLSQVTTPVHLQVFVTPT